MCEKLLLKLFSKKDGPGVKPPKAFQGDLDKYHLSDGGTQTVKAGSEVVFDDSVATYVVIGDKDNQK